MALTAPRKHVLEVFESLTEPGTIKDVYNNHIDPNLVSSDQSFGHTCRFMSNAGYLTHDNGFPKHYRITGKGRDALKDPSRFKAPSTPAKKKKKVEPVQPQINLGATANALLDEIAAITQKNSAMRDLCESIVAMVHNTLQLDEDALNKKLKKPAPLKSDKNKDTLTAGVDKLNHENELYRYELLSIYQHLHSIME